MTKTEQIADLKADREGWVCGLGSDSHTDRVIRREIKKIDKKLAELERKD